MPKIKTNKGAAKRFKRTASGKFKQNSAFGNHILAKKTTKRKRKIRHSAMVDSSNLKKLRDLLPFS